MKKECKLTQKITNLLVEPNNPESSQLWDLLHDEPLPICPEALEKKAGAKADACFLRANDTLLLIENKAYGAGLTDRQQLLYLNHFMHFIAAPHNLAFKNYKLVFLVDNNSTYHSRLSDIFTEDYIFPFNQLEKSHLKSAHLLSKGVKQSAGCVSYWVDATYRKVRCRFTINVSIVGIDVKYYE